MAPDYEIDDEVHLETPEQLRAVAGDLRLRILDLVLERAATVTELAEALGRPRGTVAYHVDALVDSGVLKVVRTRRVRAVEERFYGRVGRTIVLGGLGAGVVRQGFLEQAVGESSTAGDRMLSTIRHARVPAERAEEFFDRVLELAREFTALPREGEVVHGFVAAVYPTDLPTLPPVDESDEEAT